MAHPLSPHLLRGVAVPVFIFTVHTCSRLERDRWMCFHFPSPTTNVKLKKVEDEQMKSAKEKQDE